MSRESYFQACKSGDIETVHELNHLVAPNDMDKESDMTALMLASMQGVLEVVDYLAQLDGLDVNVSNKYGYTALMLASRHNHINVVDRLLQVQGINLEVRNKAGKTAEDLARGKQRWEVVTRIQQVKKQEESGVLRDVREGRGDNSNNKRKIEDVENDERKIIEFSDAVQMAEVQEKLHMIKKENKGKDAYVRKKRRNEAGENMERYTVVNLGRQQLVEQYNSQVKMEVPGEGVATQNNASTSPQGTVHINTNTIENETNREVMYQYMSYENGQNQHINQSNSQLISSHNIQNNHIVPHQDNGNAHMISPQTNSNDPIVSPQYPHNISSHQASFQHVSHHQISPHYVSPPMHVSPHYQSPHQVSPDTVSAAAYPPDESPAQGFPDPMLAQVMSRLETDLNDLHSLGKGFSADIALARTAIGLGMAEFYDTCVNSLVNNIAVDNVLEIVKLAEESDDVGLRERVVVFVRDNLRAVWAEKECKSVMSKYPHFLLEVMDGLLNQ